MSAKYRYEAQKKANAARKTQKTQDIKEVKMRPNIDTHDYDVKMKQREQVHRPRRQGESHFALSWP
jgi:translation initiation factor IF-3